ncbi:PREDICTED: glycine N-acyltransferase-like protein Keg1 isoform X2 [Branchiostoma belcheri]|uniref:Glycine N-acyltransferase-like protein n=1 Tax=Branchiostoma belcheri TaxID=7741 RepID=A0A6P4Z5G0_BRABE|nr:PREDICTED: glycine N-acyltransferase-like protein Keg1 isoform X2 [Branchiostoma belcheri]
MARSLARSELEQLVDSLVLSWDDMASHTKAMLHCTVRHYLDGKIPWKITFEVDRWPDYTAVLWTCDEKDTSVLAFAQDSVFLHWTSEDGLRQLLTSTSVDWTKSLILIAFPLSGLSILREHLENQGLPFPAAEDIHPCDTAYYLHKICPSLEKVDGTDDKVSVAPLQPEHSHLVSNTWRHGGTPESEERTHYHITTFPSACVYDQDGNPVSWILLNYYGSQGLGYTLPDNRGRGYFQLASKYLISTCLQKGYLPFLFIEDYNEPSRIIHRKLGYSWNEAGRCAYIRLNKNKLKSS